MEIIIRRINKCHDKRILLQVIRNYIDYTDSFKSNLPEYDILREFNMSWNIIIEQIDVVPINELRQITITACRNARMYDELREKVTGVSEKNFLLHHVISPLIHSRFK